MENNKNIIQEKSFAFAVRIVKLYKYLIEEKKEYTLSKQILRSGTSVGANIEQALGGYSKKDFRAKLSISFKEIRETKNWLRLLKETGYLSKDLFLSLHFDAEELAKNALINHSKHKINIMKPTCFSNTNTTLIKSAICGFHHTIEN